MNSSKDIDMSTNYLIEKKIEYSPSTNTLRSLIDDSQFTLLAAASECLLLLLINHGKLVSKTKLTYVGWEQYNLHVSDNTFYQNILIMRKGIKFCGINEEVIRTIPRKGMMIPNTVSVEILPLLTQEMQTCDNDLLVEDCKEEHAASLLITAVNAKPEIKKNVKKHILYSTFFLASFLLSLFYSLPKNYISSYKNIESNSNCHIQIKSEHTNEEDFESFSLINPLICDNGEFIYFTTYPYIQRVSLLMCKKEFTSYYHRNDCISYYYLEKRA